MEPASTAVTAILSVLGQMGFPGLVIGCMGYWMFQQSKRINELTDKVIAMSAENAAAMTASTGALTRLTDTLVRGGKSE